LGAALALVLAWVRLLRKQVQRQTRELRGEIEERKRMEGELQNEIEERKRMEAQVEKTHRDLIIASRQAGMAEVAISVLHNVGNVLNSVNVSASLIVNQIKQSKVVSVDRVA